MKEKIFFLIMLLFNISLSSCSDDAGPMMLWEVVEIDSDQVKVERDDYNSNLIRISLPNDYEGELKLNCTNYPVNSLTDYIDQNEIEVKPEGIKIIKIGDNSLRLIFKRVGSIQDSESDNSNIPNDNLSSDTNLLYYFEVTGKNSEISGKCHFEVYRWTKPNDIM